MLSLLGGGCGIFFGIFASAGNIRNAGMAQFDFCAGDRAIGIVFRDDWDFLWILPGEQGRAAGSHRGSAIRIGELHPSEKVSILFLRRRSV